MSKTIEPSFSESELDPISKQIEAYQKESLAKLAKLAQVKQEERSSPGRGSPKVKVINLRDLERDDSDSVKRRSKGRAVDKPNTRSISPSNKETEMRDTVLSPMNLGRPLRNQVAPTHFQNE